MQNGTDIYSNFSISPFWAIMAALAVIIVVGLQLFGSKMLKSLTLRKQQKSLQLSRDDNIADVAEALLQLDAIKMSYQQKNITSSVAAFKLSELVRATFDKLMHHNTIYQARYEVAARKLEAMAVILTNSYPAEFTDDTLAPVELQIATFDRAREVIESCR